MTWQEWVAVLAAVLAIIAVVVALRLAREQARIVARLGLDDLDPADVGEPTPEPVRRGPLVAFVANPSKPDVTAVRTEARRACAERYLPEPLWLETTVADPGLGQARAALARGADVVVAVGGDGTVRAVSEAMAHTGVPMGLLPLGTGNLLARNLDLPLNNTPAALAIALEGRNRTIDVGWLRVERRVAEDDDATEPAPAAASSPDGREAGPELLDEPSDHIFLVIGGVGFDAAMVAGADEQLKARVGWLAYFVAGVRHLHGRRLRVRVKVDDRPWTEVRLRSLMVGNCGRLPGGITLLPDAVLDDGWLDVAAIDTRGGVAGWAQLLGEVLLQGVGVHTELPAKIGRIDHIRARQIQVRIAGGQHVQVDGDILGRVDRLSARVDPDALVVWVA